ncbi:MAG: hypothetical protein J6A69_02095 [Clostridia bacterium]|nr:hypothetical protein [Clostridia bacterium]
MNPVDAYIKNEFKTESVEEATETAYLLLHGEKEAYSVGNRFELSAEERAKTYPNFSKGAILINVNEEDNINDRISKA